MLYNVVSNRKTRKWSREMELAECATALTKISKHRRISEGLPYLVRKKTFIKLTIFATIAIFNWRYYSNCTNVVSKI